MVCHKNEKAPVNGDRVRYTPKRIPVYCVYRFQEVKPQAYHKYNGKSSAQKKHVPMPAQ